MDEIKYFDMVLLEKPLCLSFGGRRFKLYQPSLGKLLLLRPLLAEIAGEEGQLNNVALEVVLRTATKRDAVCEVLALHSFSDSKSCLDAFRIEERAKEFGTLEDGEISTLFLATLSFPRAESIIDDSGIRADNERQRRLSAAKDTKGCAVCGGKTLYGGILDHAMERYGWSLQYALWGISAANLQLLAADQQVSLYLSPEERKKARSVDLAGSGVIDASDPENAGKIRELLYRKKR